MRQSEKLFTEIAMFIGDWTKGQGGERLPVINPASGEIIGELPTASQSDLDRAFVCGEAGFAQWKMPPALEREKILKKATTILESRAHKLEIRFTGQRLSRPTGKVTP